MMEPIGKTGDYYLPEDNKKAGRPQGLQDPNAFLKILVAQMKYQNPMQPQDSATFVTQLSQMASMEQMYNVSQSMNKMASAYEMARYFQLIGQQVSLVKNDEVISGQVGGVLFEDDQPYFYLAGAPLGDKYTLDQLTGITGTSTDQLLPYLSLVGLKVTINLDNGDKTGIVEKVLLQNGSAAVQVDGEIYGVDRIREVTGAPAAAAGTGTLETSASGETTTTTEPQTTSGA